jgi:hypothetical protein
MSDFFRIPSNPSLAKYGLTSLARMSHEAEDTGDDILLLQVDSEIQFRGELAQEIFRNEYIRLHSRGIRTKE